MLWLVCGAGSAQADCPADQSPRGLNGTCVCNNGTGPPSLPGAQCIVFACEPGLQQLPGTHGCCPANTSLQGNFCEPNLCRPSELQLPNGTCAPTPATAGPDCITPPPTITQILNALFGGISFAPPNFCCPSNQAPAMTFGPPIPYNGTQLQNIVYTRACCPVGQVPQVDGSCVPPLLQHDCAGGAPFNPKTYSCCPSGSWAISNTYQCCPKGTYPRPDGSCGCQMGAAFENGSCHVVCNSTSYAIFSPLTGNAVGCQACPNGQFGNPSGGCCPFEDQIVGLGECCPPGVDCTSPANKRARERSTPPAATSPTCRDGRVPREAFAGDAVCVTRQVHDQTIADNNAAPTRIKPDGNCIPGYVWREARPSDHVCVVPPTRTQVRLDNARVASTCPPGQSCGTPVFVPSENVPGPCPPGSQYIRAASGPAQCVESACPAGTHDTAVGCCPNGANGVVLGENDQVCQGPNGSARPVPPACPSGWSLYNPDQSKFGGWMCGHPPTCATGYVVQDGACVPGQKQSSTPPPPAPAPAPVPTCHDGLVPRNAFAGDKACVRPSTRTQIEKHPPRPCGGDLHCRTRPNGGTHVPVRHPTPPHRQRGGDGRWHR